MRKRVGQRNQQKTKQLNTEFVLGDDSCNKEVSHLRLKSDLIQGTDAMNKTFNKQQLTTLCAAYNVTVPKSMKKTDIIQKLKEKVLECNEMPNPEILSSKKTSGIDTTSENIEAQETETLNPDIQEFEVLEIMEDQPVQDDAVAGPSTKDDFPIVHDFVKVVGKGKRLAKTGSSPKRSKSAKDKNRSGEIVQAEAAPSQSIEREDIEGTSTQGDTFECPPTSDTIVPLISPPKRSKRTRSQTSTLPVNESKKDSKTKSSIKKPRAKPTTKVSRGRTKKSKKYESDDGNEDENCTVCNKSYKENEDWISCDLCSLWFHRQCAHLQNDELWTRYTVDEEEYTCPLCE